MKVCNKCKEIKDLSCFCKNKSMKDGFDHYCKICRNSRSAAWKKDNSEKVSKYNRLHYLKNRNYHIQKALKWSTLNRDKFRFSNRKACKKWAQINKSLINSKSANRRASKIKATPAWLSTNDFEEIDDLYKISLAFKLYTGEEYHVDHIIPLQGENICGLHVPWNLQVIPARLNLQKSNKLDYNINDAF